MSTSIPTVRSYFVVFASLILLTFLTVAVAYIPIGALHTPAALAIAIGKALLVVFFFMHLYHSDKASWILLAAAIFMFLVLVMLTLADYWSRPLMSPESLVNSLTFPLREYA